jgi:3-carboxy-cis,cis-muconate cycloisomerase
VEHKSLFDLLRQDDDVKKAGLSDDELERLCDPAHYLGLSEVMVDRVLQNAS